MIKRQWVNVYQPDGKPYFRREEFDSPEEASAYLLKGREEFLYEEWELKNNEWKLIKQEELNNDPRTNK